MGGTGKGVEKKGKEIAKVRRASGKERQGGNVERNGERLFARKTRTGAAKEDATSVRKGTGDGLQSAVEGASVSKEEKRGESDEELFAAIEKFKRRKEVDGSRGERRAGTWGRKQSGL